MNDKQQSGGESVRGTPTHVVEAVVALLLLLTGGVTAFESYKLGAGWQSDGPGAGYFPFYIGLILAISGAGILVQALRNKSGEVFVDSEQLKRVMQVLVPAAIYILAVEFLGLYLASALYIALFMVVLGKYSWLKSVSIALSVNVLFFLMFEVWFKVPLFKGSLDLLSFLGY